MLQKGEEYRIMIADDHEIVRSGLRLLIERCAGMKIVAEASSFSELMQRLGTAECDLLILDINLGDRNGIDSIKEVLRRAPALKVLVLSMYPDELYSVQAIRSGAMGYLNKSAVSQELVKAIEDVLAGEQYISQPVSDNLLYGTVLEKDLRRPEEQLSAREFEVLSLIATGMANKEIAQKLGLSPKTVSTYRMRILEKLMLENTSQLIQYALQNNIVSAQKQ